MLDLVPFGAQKHIENDSKQKEKPQMAPSTVDRTVRSISVYECIRDLIRDRLFAFTNSNVPLGRA